ncbi:MAG: winged helix-turn-helix transcriptional regulator, partial [Candidatus Hermodarchaeota archaeon]
YGIHENYRKIIELIPTIQKLGLEALTRDQKNHVYDAKRIRIKAKTYQQVFSLITNKWSLEIYYTIMMYKNCGYNDLKRALPGLNSRTLTDKLLFLEKEHIISRTVKSERPIRVNYQLSEKGKQAFLLLMPFFVYNLLPPSIVKRFPKIESIEKEINTFNDIENQEIKEIQQIE